MKVKALTMVYYNNKRQRPGSVFTLLPRKVIARDKTGKIIMEKGKPKINDISAESQFSERTMSQVNPGAPVTPLTKGIVGKKPEPEVEELELEEQVIDETAEADLDSFGQPTKAAQLSAMQGKKNKKKQDESVI